MENQSENSTNTQNSDLSKTNKQINDYAHNPKNTRRKTKEEILARYFTPRKDNELFRILPSKANKKPIEEAFFHVVQLNAAGGKKVWTKIYCPAHNDRNIKKMDKNGQPVLDDNNNTVMIPVRCPLCKKAKDILVKQDVSIKFIKKENYTEAQKKIFDKNKEIFLEANKWEAKKFYIVRGIDKGAEKDGVKFWRFKHSFRGDGTLNKLLPTLSEFNTLNQVAYSDINNGTTLSITMIDITVGNQLRRSILSINSKGKSPLSTDSVQMKRWLDDTTTWREVYLPKKAPLTTPYEYLQMVGEGVDPYWDESDSNNKHWVFPNNPDLQARANTRTQNLDADSVEDFEYASDLIDEDSIVAPVNNTVSANTKPADANTPPADIAPVNVESTDNDQSDIPKEYDDLPF